MQLWDVPTGRGQRTMRGIISATTSFGADGTTMMVATNQVLKVWDVATGRELRSLRLRTPRDGEQGFHGIVNTDSTAT